MKKQKKLLVAGAVMALMAMGVPTFMSQANNEATVQNSELAKFQVQGGFVSLHDVISLLNGEVSEGKDDTFTFKAQEKEIVIRIGSGIVSVNGEEDAYVLEQSFGGSSINGVKWEEAYVLNEEVFVPIEFVERLFDLTYSEDSLEFKKDEETVMSGEEIIKMEETEQVTEEEKTEEGPQVEEQEEVKDDKEEVVETPKEEEKKPSSENGNTSTSKPSVNNSTQTKPSGTTNNSNSNSSNNNGGNSSSSNSQTTQKPQESKPTEPTPTPEETKPVAPQPVKVTSVTTNTGNLTLEIGGTGKMNVTVSPSNADNKSVTFSSSNTGVATVDGNGNIAAKGSGTAYITATSNENSKMNVTIIVTVKEKPKTAVYTGDSVVARLRNEKGWCGSGTSAYISDYGCNMAAEGWGAEISSVTSGDKDVKIVVFDTSQTGVVSGVESVIRWMMPNNGQKVINKLYDSSYYGGTLENIDGRKVVISLKNYGIVIDIHAKYE